MLTGIIKKSVQRDISKDAIDKSKENSKICSSNPQEGRRNKTEKLKIEETNRKKKWQI